MSICSFGDEVTVARVFDQCFDKSCRGACLGDEVYRDAGRAGVERGARSDARHDGVFRKRAELQLDLAGDAAGSDEDGLNPPLGDVCRDVVGDRHPDGAVRGDEFDVEPEFCQSAPRARRRAWARRCWTAG